MGTCPTYSMQEQIYKESYLLIFGIVQESMRKREDREKKKREKRREKRKEEKKKGREIGKKNRTPR